MHIHYLAAQLARVERVFARILEPETIREYFAAIAPRLTDEEFDSAISAAIAQDSFFPVPARLIVLGKLHRAATAPRALPAEGWPEPTDEEFESSAETREEIRARLAEILRERRL